MKNPKTRLIVSLVINALIVLIEIYVGTNAFFGYVGSSKGGAGVLMFRFFTEDSNILLGLSSLLYVIYAAIALKKGTAVPDWLKVFRLIAVTATTTTFVVVLLFLAPMIAIAYSPIAYFYMFGFPNMFFTHFLCPLSAVVSFLLFEERYESPRPLWERAFITLVTVTLYAVIVGCLASFQLISADESVNNVYGFMDATAGPWWHTPLAVLLIFGATYGEGLLLLLFQKKIALKNRKE
jgi:hypothetical protein